MKHLLTLVATVVLAQEALAEDKATSLPAELSQADIAGAIDTLVADVAGLSNLLDMALIIEPAPACSDLAAAACEVGELAGHAVRAIDECAAEIAGIHSSVTAAGSPASLEPAGVSTGISAEIRAA